MPGVGRASRWIVLVEGASDRAALLALAARDGRDLAAAGVEIVSMDGVTNTRAFARHYGPGGDDLRLAGLYDAPEEEFVRRGLAAAGLPVAGRPAAGLPAAGHSGAGHSGAGHSEARVSEALQVGSRDPDALARLGFFRCTRDLEDELIRAVGIDQVEAVIEANGEGRSLRLLTQMPAQAGWTREELLRRFMTSQSGRKARYAQLLVDAAPADRVPAPLRDLLAWVCDAPPREEGAAR
ncbi:ATP-dependent endonuclease [Nocardioides sp. JQ2195]|uniref:TOPRIM nucleotidyl transferase/hydrolase domain-containing protein n=1 Tax=Nocardioides sp. JQ2195 TaxID=2592334 RepID=UPI00143EB0D8|nr:TOPRIM nucleotidyl transferase/hydrolase domain-containing protein [Nocardioides sp. JQ2195]QIX27083.1 ATP-dependent endonuclease [Nocardioides sp. JQ2195]